jgi:hypothetical protein
MMPFRNAQAVLFNNAQALAREANALWSKTKAEVTQSELASMRESLVACQAAVADIEAATKHQRNRVTRKTAIAKKVGKEAGLRVKNVKLKHMTKEDVLGLPR